VGIIAALGLAPRGTTWAQPVGAEFQVNTYTTGFQDWPAVAADADGDFVVVWGSDYQEGYASESGVFGQRYSSAGVPVGPEFQVNTYTTDDQGYFGPGVATDADGDFVVVWGSLRQEGNDYGVFGQRYTSAGTAVGAEFHVNTYTTSHQNSPAIAADTDGDFVVVWGSNFQDGSLGGVFGQRYTSAGTAVGSEFQVNTYTTGTQYFPVVATDADGDFVVVWMSQGQDGSSYGIFGQRYTSAGVPVGSEFRVNTYTTGSQVLPAVATDADGDFVVVWDSQAQDGSFRGVFGQRYTSAGTAVGPEFQVNTYTPGSQQYAAVAIDANGDYIVVWHGGGPGNSFGIFGQRYSSAGAPVGSEFQVNTYTTGPQYFPAVATDADGVFVVVWSSPGQDGSDYGVFGQRFAAAPPTIPATSLPGSLILGALLGLVMPRALRRWAPRPAASQPIQRS
jgi:hypothetical protein